MNIFYTNKYLRFCAIHILGYLVDFEKGFCNTGTPQEGHHHRHEFIFKSVMIGLFLGTFSVFSALMHYFIFNR